MRLQTLSYVCSYCPPGAYIHPKLCADVLHYRVKGYRDPVPQIHQWGMEAAKGAIVELPCHPGADHFDHSFTSKTYERVLKQHMDNYVQSGGKSI